jgi:hypothetical protein
VTHSHNNASGPVRVRRIYSSDELSALFTKFCQEKQHSPPKREKAKRNQPSSDTPPRTTVLPSPTESPEIDITPPLSPFLPSESNESCIPNPPCLDMIEDHPHESALKVLIRKILTKQVFERVKGTQMRDEEIPVLEIPPEARMNWQFTPDYCDLIVDVIAEWMNEEDLSQMEYEECLDEIVEYFENESQPSPEDLFPYLERITQQRMVTFQFGFCFQLADLILNKSIDFILGIGR